jgi:hypothetical protein
MGSIYDGKHSRILCGGVAGLVGLLPCVQKKFLIAFGAGQAARTDAIDKQSRGKRRNPDAFNRPFLQESVTHDPAGAYISAVKLELGFHQDQVFRGRTRGGHDCRQHLGNGNK